VTDDETLQQLADRYWDRRMAASPLYATLLGDHRHDDRLPALDRASLQAERDANADDADTAATLEPGTDAARLTRDLLVDEARRQVVGHDTDLLESPVDPYLGMHSQLLQAAMQTTVTTPEQAEMLLDRYAATPAMFEEVATLNRERTAAGRTPAATSVRRVIAQVEGHLASDVDDDPMLATTPPDGTAADWRDRLRTLVAEVVRPAYAAHLDFVRDEVLPAARDDDHPGLVHVPGGVAAYEALARVHTSLDLDPGEVHRIGVEHAEGTLVEEWRRIGEAALGLSDLEALFERLRSDRSLYYRDADEMVAHAEATVARAWDGVAGWVNVGPKAPCRVLPVPPVLAASMPPAYYQVPAEDGSRPGTYFVNTHDAASRPRWMYEGVAFHEAIPGHHFDRTVAQELTDVPTFRRYAVSTAHVEGWGLYSERLADEMGLYSSDLDRLGMLTADAWRAGRLVVDTGLHHHGWTRQQAIDWLATWTPLPMGVIEQEVDRYIGMPGQALAYKIGQRHIVALRARAEQTLGDAFDVAAFHDALLVEGSLPLPVLTTSVEQRLGL
jgi:uncharacterized protein (DUF885 family)